MSPETFRIGQSKKYFFFHHDIARHYTSFLTRQKLLNPGWHVLSRPPYSFDIEPSDYDVFRSPRNSLSSNTFHSNNSENSYMENFFCCKRSEIS